MSYGFILLYKVLDDSRISYEQAAEYLALIDAALHAEVKQTREDAKLELKSKLDL